ncbi:MAG: hypothetical protein R3F19_35460 [Verrucomicrobiales bacterium]
MSLPASVFIALITGIVGLIASGLVAGGYAEWYSMPDREGAGGYFIIAMAIAGAAAAFIIGIILSRVLGTTFWNALAWALGTVAGVNGIIATGLYLFSDTKPSTGTGQLDPIPPVTTAEPLARIQPDLPISELLPLTEAHVDEASRKAATLAIIGKPTFVGEMNALILADGPYETAARAAAGAMYFIGRMEKPDAALVPGVMAAGRDIRARIVAFNGTTPEQDPAYHGAADVSIRFSAWMEAARALRSSADSGLDDGNFIAELNAILELSRIRTDSASMRDVCRVASHYMNVWAGIAPHPGDPPSR